MSETPKLTLVITPRYDRERRGVILEGRLNVYVNRLVDEIVLDSVGPDRVLKHEADLMQRMVARHMNRQIPEETRMRVRYAMRESPYLQRAEFEELSAALDRAWGFEIETCVTGEDRRDERIRDLERDLTNSAHHRGALLGKINQLETRLRHEQLRGRLFKKGRRK